MTPGAFFVSAFISLNPATGLQPLDGWTQFIMPFDTKAECEDFVAMNTLPLMMQMQGSIGSMLETFHHFECLTEQDAIDKNVALGHTPPGTEPEKEKL